MPGAIGQLKVRVGCPGELLVSWKPPKDTGLAPITRYVVSVNSAAGFDGFSVGYEASAGNVQTLTGLRHGTWYYIAMKAWNAYGWSEEWSPEHRSITRSENDLVCR